MTGPDDSADAGDEAGDGRTSDEGQSGERKASLDDPADGAPLADIAAAVEQRRRRRDETQGLEDDLFEQMDVGDVDAEAVWEDLLVDPEERHAEGKEVGAGVEASRVDDPGGGDTRPAYTVPKDEFCGRCPYLGEPPELVCEHEGTDIMEVVDSGTFSVRGCPYAGDGEAGHQQYN